MKTLINPENFTHIMGSYSHGIKVDIGDCEMIFTTGEIAMDKDGKPVAPDNIEKQTIYVFESLGAILKEAGSSLDDVVKAIIYVTRMEDFAKISPIRNKYFANSKPVSTLVEINKTVKDGCDVEIEVIAIRKK
jgi:2-iminobutanoate/2-iminopropanoate deaminase